MTIRNWFLASLLLAVGSVPMMAQSNRTMPGIAEAQESTAAPQRGGMTHIPAMIQGNDGLTKAASPSNQQTAALMERLSQQETKIIMKGNLASNRSSCFALREERFRVEGEKSNMPKHYASATCTPASGIRMKSAVVVLAR